VVEAKLDWRASAMKPKPLQTIQQDPVRATFRRGYTKADMNRSVACDTPIYVPWYTGLLHCLLHLASIPAGHRYQGAVEPNDQNHPMVRAKVLDVRVAEEAVIDLYEQSAKGMLAEHDRRSSSSGHGRFCVLEQIQLDRT